MRERRIRRDAIVEFAGIGALFLAALVVIAIRAAVVSITHDEALTVISSLHSPIADIVAFSTPGLPDNNHLLYTLLAKLSVRIFGEHEWSLRLPSVCAFVVYFGAITVLLRRFVSGYVLVLFVAVAVFNPALIEAMSLARGYGLGIALMCWGTYWLLRTLDSNGKRHAPLMTASCYALASLAHLTFLLYFAAGMILLIGVAATAYRSGTRTLAQVGAAAVGPLVVTAIVSPIIFHQIAVLGPRGLLATEGLTSFYVDTIGGAVALSFGLPTTPLWPLMTGFFVLVPVVTVLVTVVQLVRADRGVRAEARLVDTVLVLALLAGACALSVLQHYVAGTAYLSGRRAISLIPLYVLVCAALARFAQSLPRVAQIGSRGVALFCIVLLGLQVRAISLDTTRTWRFDADTRVMLTDLGCLIDQRWSAPIFRLSLPWEFEPAANYYRTHLPVARLAEMDRGGIREGYDAYYLPLSNEFHLSGSLAIGQAIAGPLAIIRRYPRANAVLAVPVDSPLIDPRRSTRKPGKAGADEGVLCRSTMASQPGESRP